MIFSERKELVIEMKKDIKTKQIVVRFDNHAYDKISEYAELEHRGLGEFVRHAALFYIEHFGKETDTVDGKRGSLKQDAFQQSY